MNDLLIGSNFIITTHSFLFRPSIPMLVALVVAVCVFNQVDAQVSRCLPYYILLFLDVKI